jgi:DNA helicase II / ATP-dependent DNA helicase PcrA
MFTWTDRELNPEQSDAVRDEGNVFLVACPGSGKTKTLTYKIAYELSKLTSEREFVVAITYTHRAADEIQERIEALGVDVSRLWIGTIHAFCLEWIIKPYAIYEPTLAYGYALVDQHERERILEQLCAQYRNPRMSHFDCDYYYTATGYSLGCPDVNKHQRVHVILDEYFQILRDRRLIDFELLLWHSYRLLQQLPEVPQLLSQIFTMVLVDEYQDTKQIQYEILGLILRAGGGHPRLFMVGDPNQAIYGSLGGYAIDIDALRALTELEITERRLSRNYRSSERLIDYFGNYNVHNTVIEAAGEGRGYGSLVSYDRQVTHTDLVGEIARLIRHNVETLEVSPNEICVLAPQWIHLATMTRRLVATLPEYQFDGPGMVPFARDTENFWYKLARLALTEPSPDMYVRRLRWAREFMMDLKTYGIDLDGWTAKTLLRECNAMQINTVDGLEFLRRFFTALFERIHISVDAHQALREQFDAFFASSQARILRLQNEGVDAVSEVSFFKRTFQNRSGITVSSIHGVKGAEFDVVIAYALLDGMVPHFNDPDGDVSSRKLLYVIGSRARKNLHLFSETGRSRGWRGDYEPTPALLACEFDYDTA